MTTSSAMDCQRSGSAHYYRPPSGIPVQRGERWGAPLAMLAHLLLVALLVSPVFSPSGPVPQLGAGGAGPSGGGGGGPSGAPATRANGGPTAGERLHYVAAIANPAPLTMQSQVAAPSVEPPPERPPEKPKLEVRTPQVEPVAMASTPAPTTGISSPVASIGGDRGGSGGGMGGAGPGTGGGVGTGIGTGRGSSTGPGTGGGQGMIYPATPDFLVMPALPVPASVRGKTVELRFTLDERGMILKVEFDPTGDRGYDRLLRERLAEFRFRPAHKPDGTPVPSVYVTRLTL